MLAKIRRAMSPYQQYLQRLNASVEGLTSVLDVGCGASSPIGAVSNRPANLVGVDAHEPATRVGENVAHHDRYVVGDALKIEEIFGADSFDGVIALDVIEHFEKVQGFALLDAMEAVARRRVVVLTPNGYVPQEADANRYQEHLSGWHPDDFQLRGYEVHGVGGLSILAGERARPRVRPEPLGLGLRGASQLLTRDRPSLAFHLLAIKDL